MKPQHTQLHKTNTRTYAQTHTQLHKTNTQTYAQMHKHIHLPNLFTHSHLLTHSHHTYTPHRNRDIERTHIHTDIRK